MKDKKQKLPKRFKKKWIKALRSGKYKQGVDFLYDSANESMCCLGVAELICGNSLEILDQVNMPRELESDSKVPKCLVQQDYIYPEEKYLTIPGKLANFNDSGKSFKSIASYIERYL